MDDYHSSRLFLRFSFSFLALLSSSSSPLAISISLLLRCATIPAPRESPSTLIAVRNLTRHLLCGHLNVPQSQVSTVQKSIQQLFQTQTNLTGNRTQDHLSSNQSTDKIVATASLGRPTVSRTITFIPRNIKSSRIVCNNPCLQTQEKLSE